ncbi:MAG: 4Fe-4S dicluster domain-containing protein [Anaerolineales bacterium]|nr:4Fe-4S dicluster domain-containing protein [Anaerolineales bacterium]
MTHIITALCMHDGSCVEVCPVECIVPGSPIEEWPTYYIDRETCIDCGACIPECPYDAIFLEDEVPSDYEAFGDERLNMPVGTEGFDEIFESEDIYGEEVILKATRKLEEGEVVDLTDAIDRNDAFFIDGPGYEALD